MIYEVGALHGPSAAMIGWPLLSGFVWQFICPVLRPQFERKGTTCLFDFPLPLSQSESAGLRDPGGFIPLEQEGHSGL